MSNVVFEEVFPIARELARQKALRVIGCCGLAPDDRDDVASQLVATFYSRFGKFDGGRASVQTYASRVMDKELASILRYRLAVRRKHGVGEVKMYGEYFDDFSTNTASNYTVNNGSIAIDTNAVAGALADNGFAQNASGALYGTTTVAGTDDYQAGSRRSAAGALVYVVGAGVAVQNGNPVDANGALATI